MKKMSKLKMGSRIMSWDTARWRNERESKTTHASGCQVWKKYPYLHD